MTAPATAPTTTMTLRRIIAMGSEGTPWAFVPIARQALGQAGFDPELWFLLAANLADLGLGTLASEELGALCDRRPSVGQMPAARDLRAKIESMPHDRIEPGELVANAERAVDALKVRGIDLTDEFSAWKAGLGKFSWFRSSDGNIVRKSGDELSHLYDHLGEAKQLGETHIAQASSSDAPLTIEGIDPPWMLIEVCEKTPHLATGYQPGIRLIQTDVSEFLDGCALADISALLLDERVDLFLGEESALKLKETLARDAGTPIAGPYMPLRTLRKPMTPSAADVFRAALTEQDHEHQRLLKSNHLRDTARDEGWWRSRISDAIEGKADPLRVLIPVSRFTTVLGSMCQDLAESLRAKGCEVCVLTEPGPNRKLSVLAYSRAIDGFDPDIILAPNHTRRDLERVITGHGAPLPEQRVLPAGVPFVVWIQDAMPHLLTFEAGASIAPLDVVIGHVSSEMINDLGYPKEALESVQLVASERRFSIKNVDQNERDKLACDAAMMTHHSETPEAMRDRLLSEIGSSPAARRAVEAMLPEIEEIVAKVDEPPGTYFRARTLLDQHQAFDISTKELLLQNFVLRIVDQSLRHQAAMWAGEICEARGWSFRIFGKGWEDHPTLSRFAGGDLPHDSSLAAAYAGAGVTMHVSEFNAIHQRIFECALSGGCPIIRCTLNTLKQARLPLMMRILRELEPDDTFRINERRVYMLYEPGKSPETAEYTRLHLQTGGQLINGMLALREILPYSELTTQPESNTYSVLNDLSDMFFDSKHSLETTIEEIKGNPDRRARANEKVTRITRAQFTHDALAERLLMKIYKRVSPTAV
ncbi:MAG: hypothetical protein ED559_12950 [Phycisphaera sp.]|nr:MAG: hypothetical protein ED559_12950 [Phycisphaera sp.]